MPNATSGRIPGAAVWHDPVMAEALARFRHIRPAAVAHCRSAPTSGSKKEARAGARRDAEQEIQALPGGQEDSAPAPTSDHSDVVNCTDTTATDFPTPPGDPNGLDAHGDGVSCES
jgi:hypothetical protein